MKSRYGKNEGFKPFRYLIKARLAVSLSLLVACNGGRDGSGNGKETNSGVPNPIDYARISYFKASNTGEDDQFGHSVSLSADGNRLAVGAHYENSPAKGIDGDATDDGSANTSGAVYVFDLSGDRWRQTAYVKPSNTTYGLEFGASLSLGANGGTLAVGAPGERSNAKGIDGDQSNDSVSNAGAAYVFDLSGDSWIQTAYVKASNTEERDRFGVSVSLSADGNTLAVGATGEDSNARGVDGDQSDDSVPGAGAAYVFFRNGGTWTQQAYIKASNTGSEGDFFGESVSLSADGNTLAVGAYFENTTASDSGAVYVFVRNGGTWTQQVGPLKASDAGAGDRFGFSVGLSADGNRLAVGANYEDSAARGIGGDPTSTEADNSGAAYVFFRNGGTWAQQAYIKASNTGASDEFGESLSLSQDGKVLAVGASHEDGSSSNLDGDQTSNGANQSGAVYVFSYDGVNWSQQAYVKASNTGEGDRFGVSVSLSADGKTLATGAKYEDGSATGVDATADDESSDAGTAYVWSANP